MKICLDGFALSSLEGTGLYSYSHGLIMQLIDHYPQGDYHLIWNDSPKPKLPTEKEVNLAPLKVNRISGDFSGLERYLKTKEITIYHSPNNGLSMPSNKVCKYVITVHDLIALSDEQYVDQQYKCKFLTHFPTAVKCADKIIAVSDFIKQDLLTYFSIPENKIEVIYPTSSLDSSEGRNVNIKNILKYKYNLESPFILYAGSIHKRKNLRTLLSAFRHIVKKHPETKLVIVGKTDGKRDAYYKSLLTLIDILEIRNSVIFTGIVPLKDMYYFYSQSHCFINLSEYEGFPLTSLEAMECGTPVVCSNISSMREVVGSGGILINQRDEQEIVSTILKILNDNEYRNALRASASSQARNFDSSLSTKKIFNLYESFI